MSYSLPIRALSALHRKSASKIWPEHFANVLLSTVSLPHKSEVMGRFQDKLPSVTQFSAQWREFAALDLSPTGMVLWHSNKEDAIAQIFNAHSVYSQVIDRSTYTEHGIQTTRPVSKIHRFMLDMYTLSIEESLARQKHVTKSFFSPRSGFDLKDLARILDAPSIIQDSCDFFLAFPGGKVSQLYAALGLHPRTAERRFLAEGVTAMALKRACALSSATKYVLWSDLTLAQIAGRCGYSDCAHLHRDFRNAAGGIPPSVFWQVGRLMRGHAVHTSALALKVHDHVDEQAGHTRQAQADGQAQSPM